MKALIIIDMQQDLCEGGPLANFHSLENISMINKIRDDYELVIHCTKVYPKNHISFKNSPKNCVVNTPGAKIHADLIIKPTDIIILRGSLQQYESESIFYDAEDIDKTTDLKSILKAKNVKNLYFCGNGFESCIFSSIVDAYIRGYNCFLIKNAVGFGDREKAEKCYRYLTTLNVSLI
jgi:nicotinamidase/pyrazinamidase